MELYGAFLELRALDLEENKVGGALHEGVGSLEGLRTLKLNDNGMAGDVPFDALSRLEHLGEPSVSSFVTLCVPRVFDRYWDAHIPFLHDD